MLVEDVMTRDVAAVHPEAPLVEAIRIMTERRVSGLPVIDGQGALVGILTEGDLLRRVETGTGEHRRSWWVDCLLGPGRSAAEYVRTHGRRVQDVMTRAVATVGASASLADVVGIMERRHIKRVPVLEAGRLVGIVSRADLVRALGRALSEEASGSDAAVGDAALRDRLETALGQEPWFTPGNVRIGVRDGVVSLDGIVTDERTRSAMMVAAQNVPGVRKVLDRLTWIDASTGMAIPLG